MLAETKGTSRCGQRPPSARLHSVDTRVKSGEHASAEKCVEAGVGAQGIKVRIFRRPILEEGAVLHDFSKAGKGILCLAEKGIDTSHVVEDGGFLGIDGECAARPVVAFRVFPDAREDTRAEIERARVVRMILSVFL